MTRSLAVLWCASAFCSAFLSFVVQPLLAKWLLPSFGGSPSTWAACLVFFQVMLLGGYAHAWLLSRLPLRWNRALHAALCLGVIVFSCTAELPPLHAAPHLPPGLRIVWLLACSAGLPYLLTACTAPLLSDWAAQLRAAVPHRLYAVSNLGSLLALAAYPAWVEPSWSLSEQYTLYCRAVLLAAVLSLTCLLQTLRTQTRPERAAAPVTWRARLGWSSCAFVPSLLLVAVSTHISVDLAPTPVLWIVPLAVYLLSFIAAFAGWVSRARGALAGAWVLFSALLAHSGFAAGTAQLWLQLTAALGSLACAGLLCHDTLVGARPAPAQLTSFYVWLSIGGALGGVSATFLAPWLFRDYYELELGSALCYALLWYAGRAREQSALRASAERRWLVLGALLVLPLMAAGCLLRAGYFGSREVRVLERRRSFLGALKVSEDRVARMLTHGRIRHGMQLIDPARSAQPTMYYGPGTALATVLSRHRATTPRRMGIVGLGVGTLAAFGKAGDQLSFFELDPAVVQLARQRFTYLARTPAAAQIEVGDGRLSLARAPGRALDILVLDAFASDAVPVHLLTAEAFAEYLRQLAPDGVLLANVSNRHLAVDRVVRAAAKLHGLACAVVDTGADATRFVSSVRWAVLTRDAAQLARLLEGHELRVATRPAVLWTDARASVWSIIK